MSNITKGLTEAFGRYDRRDAYQRDYDSSIAGMGKRQSQAYQADGGANDEGWDEPQHDYTLKPVAKKGFYFYKVPADQDDKAREVGLFQTKTGKWYSPFQNTRADMFFGTGKFWAPKNESIQEEQLDELSPQTLASYKKKAGADATQADKRGDYKRGDKRMSGIMKATRKEFDNDAKGVAEGTEQVYKVLAVDKSNALSKQVKLKVKASSLDEVFERLAINDWYPLEINGVEVINGKRLKQGVAEGSDINNLTNIAQALGKLKGREAFVRIGDPSKSTKFKRGVIVDRENNYGIAPGTGSEHTYWLEDESGKSFKAPSRDVFVSKQGVAEGSLNEFAPDGFNGGDDGDGFDPDIAKMAQDDGFTKGVSLADGATLERAMAINYWHSQHGGMYKQYFAKGFKEGRLNKIKHDNRQYNLNLKLMKDGSIRHGEQGVAEEKQRLDPSCWKGYKKQGTKMKGDTRVNNCVPVKESAIMKGLK